MDAMSSSSRCGERDWLVRFDVDEVEGLSSAA